MTLKRTFIYFIFSKINMYAFYVTSFVWVMLEIIANLDVRSVTTAINPGIYFPRIGREEVRGKHS